MQIIFIIYNGASTFIRSHTTRVKTTIDTYVPLAGVMKHSTKILELSHCHFWLTNYKKNLFNSYRID